MLQLTKEEFDSLRSQIVISKGKGGRRYLPYAFTEQGVAICVNLRLPRAIHANEERSVFHWGNLRINIG
jgi:hypothetical protein